MILLQKNREMKVQRVAFIAALFLVPSVLLLSNICYIKIELLRILGKLQQFSNKQIATCHEREFTI